MAEREFDRVNLADLLPPLHALPTVRPAADMAEDIAEGLQTFYEVTTDNVVGAMVEHAEPVVEAAAQLARVASAGVPAVASVLRATTAVASELPSVNGFLSWMGVVGGTVDMVEGANQMATSQGYYDTVEGAGQFGVGAANTFTGTVGLATFYLGTAAVGVTIVKAATIAGGTLFVAEAADAAITALENRYLTADWVRNDDPNDHAFRLRSELYDEWADLLGDRSGRTSDPALRVVHEDPVTSDATAPAEQTAGAPDAGVPSETALDGGVAAAGLDAGIAASVAAPTDAPAADAQAAVAADAQAADGGLPAGAPAEAAFDLDLDLDFTPDRDVFAAETVAGSAQTVDMDFTRDAQAIAADTTAGGGTTGGPMSGAASADLDLTGDPEALAAGASASQTVTADMDFTRDAEALASAGLRETLAPVSAETRGHETGGGPASPHASPTGNAPAAGYGAHDTLAPGKDVTQPAKPDTPAESAFDHASNGGSAEHPSGHPGERPPAEAAFDPPAPAQADTAPERPGAADAEPSPVSSAGAGGATAADGADDDDP